MEDVVKAVLAEMQAWGQAHDAGEAEHGRRMLNLEPDTAHLLSILVQSSNSKRLLEIGTSNGYSTVWLGWAARQTGGHVVSIERSPDKRALAQENLERAGLSSWVTLLTGDARQTLAELAGPFDLVFLDADRLSYPTYLPLILPRLTDGALLLADNVLSHPEEIRGYLEEIGARDEFDHMVLSVGKGLSVAYSRKRAEQPSSATS